MLLLDLHARPVIGHRGNRALSPENTLPSLLEAVSVGADALEFDVQVTRDGALVLMHDLTLAGRARRIIRLSDGNVVSDTPTGQEPGDAGRRRPEGVGGIAG